MPEERLGWRDEKLSQRHRLWGFDCPATDIDFLLLEYHQQRPVALVDYKFAGKPVNIASPSLRAVSDLATIAGLPFLIAKYNPDLWTFEVIAYNALARENLPLKSTMSERQWVSFLYTLRGEIVPTSLLAHFADAPWCE